MDVLQKGDVLGLVVFEKLFGDFFNVQRFLHALGDFDHCEVGAIHHFGQFKEHGAQLGHKQIDRLAGKVAVLAQPALGFVVFIAPALGPDPEALGGFFLPVQKNTEVFSELLRYFTLYRITHVALWNTGLTIAGNRKNCSTGQLSQHAQ